MQNTANETSPKRISVKVISAKNIPIEKLPEEKISAKILLIWFVLITTCYAQQSDSKAISLQLKIFSPDKTRQLTLNTTADYDEPAEGYILQSSYTDLADGKFQKGGFSFLEDEIFGNPVDVFKNKWAQNNFPVQDLETLTNGVFVSKVFSFRISALVNKASDDTVSLFFKYTTYDLQNKGKHSGRNEFDPGFDVKLRYKLIKVPFGHDIQVDFAEELFEGKKIILNITKLKDSSNVLLLPDDNTLFDQVRKSAKSSELNIPAFNFNAEFLQTDIETKPIFEFFQIDKALMYDREFNIKRYTALKNQSTGEISSLAVPVYYAHLSFPFILYNKEKADQYKNYKSKDNVFKSDYDIIIVPVENKKDTVSADVFISYTKLNIDRMQRWTPIRKRI